MTHRHEQPDEALPDIDGPGVSGFDISATVPSQSTSLSDDESWETWRDQMLHQQATSQVRRENAPRTPHPQATRHRVTGSAGDSAPNERGIQSSEYSGARGTPSRSAPVSNPPAAPSAGIPTHQPLSAPASPPVDTGSSATMMSASPEQSDTPQDQTALHASGFSEEQADQDFAALQDDDAYDDEPVKRSGWRFLTKSRVQVGNLRFGGNQRNRNLHTQENAKPVSKRRRRVPLTVFGVLLLFGILGIFAYDTITKWNGPINYHGVVQEKVEREVRDRDSDGDTRQTTEYYLILSGGTSDGVRADGEYKVNRVPYIDCNVGQHFYQHPVTFRGSTCSDIELDITDEGLVNPETGESVEL